MSWRSVTLICLACAFGSWAVACKPSSEPPTTPATSIAPEAKSPEATKPDDAQVDGERELAGGPKAKRVQGEGPDEGESAGADLVKPFKIVQVDSEASQFFYGVQDAKGQEVPLPKAVEEGVYGALYPTFAGRGRYLIYDVYLKDTEESELRFYDFETEEDAKLVRFYPGSSMLEYGWVSSDGKMVLAINKNSTREGYGTKLFALTLEDGALKRKKKYDVNPHYFCGSLCSVVDLAFVGPRKIRYLELADEPDPPPHKRRYRELKL